MEVQENAERLELNETHQLLAYADDNTLGENINTIIPQIRYHKLRVFENKVLRRISGPKEGKLWEAREDCIMRGFVT
jgi:hypothetical protein